MDQENSKTQGTELENSKKKTRRKEWRKEKEEIFEVCGGSHTHAFSISQEHPQACALV
jgi:hypothetical protein